MNECIAFIITIGGECIAWLGSMKLLGVSLAGIIVGTFLLCVILKGLLIRP